MHIHKFLATTVVLSFVCANVANSMSYSSETSQLEYKLHRKGTEENLKEQSSDNCPVWMYLDENNTCICGTDLGGVVQCSNISHRVYIQTCSCMIYDNSLGVVAGSCFYGCSNEGSYNLLPLNKSDLNTAMCGRLNRTGRLCGQCSDGYSPLVYSYDMQCVNCTNSEYNWLKFTTIAFFPLTVLYFVVVLFKVNIMTPQLYGFITFSQVIASPIVLRAILLSLRSNNSMSTAARTAGTLYGVWNLDFFRTLLPKTCLNVTTLTTLALDFAVAIYPLVLVIFTYILIELHARGYRLVMWLWRPFHKCFVHFNRAWDIQSSIIKAFATFLLLSYVKLINVTFDLIVYVRVYDVNKSAVGTYLYYDASYEYFGGRHLPYAISSIIVIVTVILPPVFLLFFYPMNWFQKCLNSCHLRSQGLHIFIECFHGYYKDGTEPGTRDCRWFAVFYFLCRVVIFMIYGTTKSITFSISVIMLTIIGVTVITVQPYKSEYSCYNTVDALLFLILGMLYTSVTTLNTAQEKAQYFVTPAKMIISVFVTIPLIYIILVVLYGIYCKCKGNCYNFKVTQRMITYEREPIMPAYDVTPNLKNEIK